MARHRETNILLMVSPVEVGDLVNPGFPMDIVAILLMEEILHQLTRLVVYPFFYIFLRRVLYIQKVVN